MPVDNKNLTALQALAGELPPPERLHGLVGLAGNTLARQIALVRVNQTRLEAERLARIEGADAPRARLAKSKADAAAAQVDAVVQEIDRLRIDPPRPGEGELGVYGYVRLGGKPAARYTVVLMTDSNQQAVTTTTLDDGSFSLLLKTSLILKLAVLKGKTVLYADDVATIDAGPIARYRIVDLAPEKDDPVKGSDPVKPGDTPDYLAELVGLSIGRALAWLQGKKMTLERLIITASGAQDGLVTRASGDKKAARLWISLADKDASQLDPLAALMASRPEAKELNLSKPEAARQILKYADARSIKGAYELLALNDRELGKRFGLAAPGQAKSLRVLLETSLKLIEVE